MFEQIFQVPNPIDLRHGVLALGMALAAWAAWSDLKGFTIPNRIPAALIVTGTVWILISGASPMPHLAAFSGVLLVGFCAYLIGFFGAGDAKFLAALALWMEPASAIVLVLITLLLGAGLALVWTMSGPLRAMLMTAGMRIDPEPPAEIPFGIAIAAAAGLEFLQLWSALPALP